jgi:hypothetical protein
MGVTCGGGSLAAGTQRPSRGCRSDRVAKADTLRHDMAMSIAAGASGFKGGTSKVKRKTEQQLWATAYHEAGHVVAALAYGKGIRRQGATIVPDLKRGAAGNVYMLKHIPGDPSVGGAYRGDRQTGRMRLRIEEDVIVRLAGGAAQRRFRPSSVRSYHSRTDNESATDLLMYIVGDERELKAYWRWLMVRTENFVRCPPRRMQIQSVAKALMERKTLSPGELRQIYVDALGGPISLKQP